MSDICLLSTLSEKIRFRKEIKTCDDELVRAGPKECFLTFAAAPRPLAVARTGSQHRFQSPIARLGVDCKFLHCLEYVEIRFYSTFLCPSLLWYVNFLFPFLLDNLQIN